MIKKLICDNSLNMLNHIDEQSVHLVVTSPPYNIDMPYDVYKDMKTIKEYMSSMKQVFSNCYKALVSGGRVCINIPSIQYEGKFTPLFVYYTNIMEELGFAMRSCIVWHKQAMSKNTAWGSYMSASNPHQPPPFEYILVFHKDSPKLIGENPDITKEEFVKWSNPLWDFKPETSFLGHPVPFPVELPARCIKFFSFPGQIVMDPFAGVCTTALAAEKLNRGYACFDLSEKYINIGRQRVNDFKMSNAACVF